MMLGSRLGAQAYIEQLRGVLAEVDLAALDLWSDLLYQAWERGRFVFIIGNGGSATTASHMAEDLGKSTLRPSDLRDETKRRMKVLSLTDNAGWILAVGNDLSYDQIFVQQIMNLGGAEDLVIAISGSGNSPNVLEAVQWANRHDLITFGLTGFDGGHLKRIARHGLHIPLDDMGMVESVHLSLFHWVLDDVFGRINREGRYAPAGERA